MPTASVFLVVGRRQWGKSRTIRALATKPGWVPLGGKRFFVRMMSNDDKPEDFEDFIADLDPKKKPYVLVAYCPERGSPLLLKTLARKYRVHAFVLEHRFRKDDRVSTNEVTALRQYGIVKVFEPIDQPASERARALERFILGQLRKAAA
jgi:hypothetical protein